MNKKYEVLFEKALAARENSSAKYSNFKVGAVIETADGKFYSGTNIESSSYGLSICAERVALFNALANNERTFIRIGVVADSKNPCSPCGACRQLLYDYAKDIEVVMFNTNREMKILNIKDLLTYPFDL